MCEPYVSRISDLPDALIVRIFGIIPCRLHHGLATCKIFSNILIGADNFPLYLRGNEYFDVLTPCKLLRYTGSIALRIRADGDLLRTLLSHVLDAVAAGWTRLDSIDISCVALPHLAAADVLRPILLQQANLR